jgi:predicted SAM-dependent methyltransferase
MLDDALLREGRPERRPISAPNTRSPEETVADYLRDTPTGKRGINLGCGGNGFAGWLNLDQGPEWHVDIACDLTQGLPFRADNQFDAVYSEAFFEHIDRPAAQRLLQDCFRVLRPGGRARITIPDLMRSIQIYLDDSKHPETHSPINEWHKGTISGTRCELFNYVLRGEGHTYFYDREEINWLFTACGFVDICASTFGRSDFPLLQNVESRPEGVTLITEGRKG